VDGKAVDAWALGITLYVLLYGKLPWEFADAQDLFEAIQQRPIELRPLARFKSSSTMGGSLFGRSLFTTEPPPMPTPPPPALAANTPGKPPLPSHNQRSTPTVVASTDAGPDCDDDDDHRTPVAGTREAFDMATFSFSGHSMRNDTMPSEAGVEEGGAGSSVARSRRQLPRLSSVGLSDAAATRRDSTPSLRRSATRSQLQDEVADDAWRRVLYGLLQRDPKQRTTLPELRRQLTALERRLRGLASSSLTSDPLGRSAFSDDDTSIAQDELDAAITLIR
jgi:serine/threonine protein kinase